MALKHLIILLPLLFASCALGKMKIYCTEEDEVAPKKDDKKPDKKDSPKPDGKDGGAKDCPTPAGGGGGKDCPTPAGGDGGKNCPTPAGGDGGKDCPTPAGGDGGKNCPTPAGGDGGKDCPTPGGGAAPKGGDGGKDCPTPDGGGAAAKGGDGGKDCPTPDDGGTDGGKDCPTPAGGGADGGKDCPTPAGGGGGKDCPTPAGGGGGKDCPTPAGGGGGKDCPTPAGGGGGKDCPTPAGGGGGKDCPTPAGGGGGKDCPTPAGGGGGKDCPTPAGGDGGKDCPNPAGGDGGKDCPTPGGGAAPKGGDGGKDCPTPAGGDGGKNCPTPAGGDGGKNCPTPAGGDGGKDCPGGGAAPKGGDGGKDCPTPAGGDGGKECPTPAGGDGGKNCPTPAGGDGGKDCPGGGAAPKGGDGGKDCPGKGGDGGKNCPTPKGCDGDGGKDCPNKKGGDDKKKDGAAPFYKQPILDSDYKGEWIIHNPNCGVNAMQHQLMPNNKAVWFDTTNLGPSARELGPKGNCPANPDNNNEPDCFAHAVQYDIESGNVKSVYVETDPWCSSGHLLPSGDLLSTGGNKMGGASVRLLKVDDPAPKFVDKKDALGAPHWYATNCILEDGSAAIIGGRDSYTYDIVGPTADFKPNNKQLPFLEQTTTPAVGPGLHVENNLYPFCYLLPDGNVFIFANDRAISFNPQTGKTVKEYPVLQGGSRNYPPSGQSALLPLRLTADNQPVTAEVVVCGGNKADAFPNVDPRYTQNRVFAPALSDCNRIVATADNPTWQKEQDMPTPRVMGDLLQLPNGQFLLINGAKKGTSGWDDGEDPNFTPTVYMPENAKGERFRELKPTNIPRMYHSSSAVLPDGKILVAGSNAHQFYTYDGNYPTELRVEKFSPHYLDPKLEKDRPVITADATDKQLKYGKDFKVTFTIASSPKLADGDVIVTLLHPPFTTHGYSQNQRMLICGITKVDSTVVNAVAPPSGKIAPPGYYMLFISHRNIPSKGVWVQVGA